MNFDDLEIKSKRPLKVMLRGYKYSMPFDATECSMDTMLMFEKTQDNKLDYLYIEVFP